MPTLEMTAPLRDGESPMDWLVVPRAQSGSGWAQEGGESQTGGAATWWGHVFRWHQFLAAAPADMPQRDQLDPSRMSNESLFEKVQAGEASACATGGLATVSWGDAQARLIDVFPGLLRREVDRPEEPQPAVLSAMLAMDRRRDHLSGDLDDVLTDAKHELPRMRLAARGGRLDTPLDVQEAQAIIGGPLPEIRKRLGRWLIDDQERRVRKWHGIVSRSIQNSFSSLYGSGGMPALSALCALLMDQWPSLWQHEVDRVGYPLRGEHDPILNWFFVVERNQDRMDMPAGAGNLWRLYQDEPQGMAKSSLVQRLLNDSNPDWSFLVVQDYQHWRQQDPEALEPAWKAYAVELAKVKTWVAVKLPSQSGFAPGLMVVHIGDTKDAAWASVLHLLVVTAQRLFPPFMLALSEQHERTAWAAAVVHEIKTDALVLQQLVKQARDEPSSMATLMPRLLDLAHGIDNLSRDFLSTLDERFDRPVPDESAAAWVDVGEQLTTALAPWRLRYPHIECTPDFSHLGQAPIHLAAHRLWRRVIRVLLHNAFRHGRVQVEVKAVLAGNHLQLTVRNLASADAVTQLQLTHHQQLGDLNAPFARMRVGLRNARLLCKEGGRCIAGTHGDGETRWAVASDP